MLGLPKADLEAFVGSMGSKPFRARQLMNWLYKRGEGDIAAMTDLAKDFRAELVQRAEVAVPEIVKTQIASDGTRKWLLSGGNGQAFEMVYIPEEDRGTLCISSQVGCALDCSFCSTAQQGFNRNLTTAEIVGQVWLANRELGWQVGDNRIITNIVFMGMGEPLANFRNVVPAIRIFLDDLGFDISRRRVTLVHLGARAADLQARRGSELRAGGVAARAERRAAQPARAHQPQTQHRRVARGLLALPRRTERPQRHVRIRDARRHQRPAGARARARKASCATSRPSSTSFLSIRFPERAIAAHPRRRSRNSATNSCSAGSSSPSAGRAATISMRPVDNSRARLPTAPSCGWVRKPSDCRCAHEH